MPEKAIDIAPSTAAITGRAARKPKRAVALRAGVGTFIAAQGSGAARARIGLPLGDQPTTLRA
jgi:hypothetical protein